MSQNNNKEPLLEWAFFISDNQNERIKKYKDDLEKYEINAENWSFDSRSSPFKLLDNYIMKQYCICEASGYIYYYNKNKKPAIEDYTGIGPTKPKQDAKFALFPLNLIAPGNGMLFCFFKKNENKETYKQDWIFDKFISSSESSSWNNILIDLGNSSTSINILERLGVAKFDPTKITIKDKDNKPGFDIKHVKKDDRLDRFLPKNVSDMFKFVNKKCKIGEIKDDYRAAIKNLIEAIIGFNIDSINDEERLYSWDLDDLSKFANNGNEDGLNYDPINFLYPLRFKNQIRAAMVIRVTIGNKKPILKTILDLKQAYMGAKLYNPYFKSDWLTLENIKITTNIPK